jgi:hypothetical protein
VSILWIILIIVLVLLLLGFFSRGLAGAILVWWIATAFSSCSPAPTRRLSFRASAAWRAPTAS